MGDSSSESRLAVDVHRVSAESVRPDVSVIVPVYNKAKYLKACLESVLSQNGIVLEVICIDDASTDGSPGILREFADLNREMKVLTNATRRGAAYSRNRGLEQARGAWVQFTDADDVLPQGSLNALVEAMRRTGAEAGRGSIRTLRDGQILEWPPAAIAAARAGTMLDLTELWIPWFHTAYMISRELLVRRDVRYPEQLSAGEDPVFIARMLVAARRICVIPSVTYLYRQDERRPEPTRRTLEDYLRHAELIKEIYAGPFWPCWEIYRPFIQEDLRLLLSQVGVSPSDEEEFKHLIEHL
jgi:glycosyltransferase involved in cell wall biosynthesis